MVFKPVTANQARSNILPHFYPWLPWRSWFWFVISDSTMISDHKYVRVIWFWHLNFSHKRWSLYWLGCWGKDVRNLKLSEIQMVKDKLFSSTSILKCRHGGSYENLVGTKNIFLVAIWKELNPNNCLQNVYRIVKKWLELFSTIPICSATHEVQLHT